MTATAEEVWARIVGAARTAKDGECPECANVVPERIIWEDENWILSYSDGPVDLAASLLLQTREHDKVGQMGDEMASEFGRISNRIVRIIENLPQARYVDVARYGAHRGHFHVWYFAPFADGSREKVDLHTVATKLANWGGHVRA
jgi:diadenosine tetraphosphate (Ap4A) HIT family hydrolase